MYRSITIGYACEPYIQQTRNSHLRRILAQFRTGSNWLHIETGRHRKQDRKDRTCPMCTHRIINPGLPLRSVMPSIVMRSAAIPLRMSTMPSLIALIAQLMQMPESNIEIFSESYHHCWRLSGPASLQSAGQISHLGQDLAYEQSLV